MKYNKVVSAEFIERNNRFVATCRVNGTVERVHVRNTGRCAELLLPGALVFLEPASAETGRSTRWSLVSVEKAGRMFNLDSQMPNRVFREAVENRQLELPGIGDVQQLKSEVNFEDSRLDFYIHGENKRAFAEIKGVTLEQNGIARFPDAPTLRGIKHLHTLMRAVDKGYDAFAVFVLQFSGAEKFQPNWGTHREFGEALRRAKEHGVKPICFECAVTSDEICYKKAVFAEI